MFHALLLLREWNQNLTIQELEFNAACFWIQAHDIHFVGIKISNVDKWAQVTGKLIQKEENDEEMFMTRKFL